MTIDYTRGSKTLLMGEPGTGKTRSLTTFIPAGIELFDIATDPGGDESILEAMQANQIPMDKFHYAYVSAASASWDTYQQMARMISSMSYEQLQGIKTGINKADHQQFMQLLMTLSNFKCQLCKKEFGAVDSWGPDRALALDSLSGVNTMAQDMMIGAKPSSHQGEWGVSMNAEEKLIKKLCADLRCFAVVTAHVERELDPVAGNVKLMVGALGSKLAPKLPKDFSDVIMAKREGTTFVWSNAETNAALKSRFLPLGDKHRPSFGPIVDEWRKRQAYSSTVTVQS